MYLSSFEHYKKSKQKFSRFKKYYVKDSKKFINKIQRDYKKTGQFPYYILKSIKKIDKSKYDSAVCVLRGAIPYAVLFESLGWQIHYVLCGRKNEKHARTEKDLRFNGNIDSTIKKIKNKKILIIENNSLTGNTPGRTLSELKNNFNIKKPDLFLDYFVDPSFLGKNINKKLFFKFNKKKQKRFNKIILASKEKVLISEKNKLIDEYLKVLK